jgi:hypothetical protein
MLQEVKQRPYIDSFLQFVRTFLIDEEATVDEVNLVEANLDILKSRIADAKSKTKVSCS